MSDQPLSSVSNGKLLRDADTALREYVRRGNRTLSPAASAVAAELARWTELRKRADRLAELDEADEGLV